MAFERVRVNRVRAELEAVPLPPLKTAAARRKKYFQASRDVL